MAADGAVHWGTAALIAADPQSEPAIRKTDAIQDSANAIGSKLSGGIIAAVPSAFYVASRIRHDSYGQATSLLVGEAVVDDTMLMIVAKAITRSAAANRHSSERQLLRYVFQKAAADC